MQVSLNQDLGRRLTHGWGRILRKQNFTSKFMKILLYNWRWCVILCRFLCPWMFVYSDSPPNPNSHCLRFAWTARFLCSEERFRFCDRLHIIYWSTVFWIWDWIFGNHCPKSFYDAQIDQLGRKENNNYLKTLQQGHSVEEVIRKASGETLGALDSGRTAWSPGLAGAIWSFSDADCKKTDGYGPRQSALVRQSAPGYERASRS